MSVADRVLKITGNLDKLSKGLPNEELNSLENSANIAGKSWSGSWLGYHSRVYYGDFEPIPPGARFSIEWGFQGTIGEQGTKGNWGEYEFDNVVEIIKTESKVTNLSDLKSKSERVAEEFDDAKSEIMSLLTTVLSRHSGDKFLSDLLVKIEECNILSYNKVVRALQPSGQHISRDMIAVQAGFQTPPHISVLAEMSEIKYPYTSCSDLAKLTRRAASHVENLTQKAIVSERVGTNIFIGHGRSAVWRDLKDFIQDRMRLPYDEFNRVPVAGVTNIARLSQMLDNSAIAFIVLTAEDEQVDSKMHARMNVIHEAGLFQGRLGFEKAILLLEEGCEEFSNVQGLGQIRFPAGNISAKFEDIRQVLEREGLIE